MAETSFPELTSPETEESPDDELVEGDEEDEGEGEVDGHDQGAVIHAPHGALPDT